MKHLIKSGLILLSISTLSHSASAQQCYLRVNTGYSTAMAGMDFYDFYPFIITNSDAPYTSTRFSLGQGFNTGAAFGYMFNDNIGVELGASYLVGSESVLNRPNFNDVEYNIQYSSRMLQITPSLVIEGGFKKINPYGRVGLLIGFGSINHTLTQRQFENEFIFSYKYHGGLAIGYTASVGANYFLNDKFSIFAELTFIGLQYSPTKGYDPQSSPPQRKDYPMSSLGLNIGVKMKF